MKLDADLDPKLRDVLETAAVLDTTEYKIFDLSYIHWFGQRAPHELIERHFTAYMFEDIVPHWVHHFTRHVQDLSRRGHLRLDDYGLKNPPATRQMIFIARAYAVALVVTLAGLLLLALNSENLVLIAKNCYFPPCY